MKSKTVLLNITNYIGISLAILPLFMKFAYAEQYFNPSFLSDGLADADISDLDYFQNGGQYLPGSYRVDIYVNGEFNSTADITFVSDKQDNKTLFPCFSIQKIKSFGVKTQEYRDLASQSSDDTCVAFTDIIPGSSIDYSPAKQILRLTFPQASLYDQARGYVSPDLWEDGIKALFVNYYFSGSNDSHKSDSYYLNLDSGINLGAWQFRQSSAWSYNHTRGETNNKFQTLRTFLQRPIIALKSQLVVGDGTTASDVFDALGFRGVRLFSTEAMYPTSQQGYAPSVRGIAKTNAKVVVRQNGYVIYQTYVPPGEFVLDDLSPSSTNGDLSVTVEESDGSVQNYIVPYSTLPLFQREGRIKYDLVLGEFRSGNNSQSKPNFIQGSIIAGFKAGLSLYAGTQLSDKYKSGLIGIGKNFGKFGALSFDITHAQSELVDGSQHSGNSFRMLYAKSLSDLGTTFQLLGYRYSTEGFYTLSDVAYKTLYGYSVLDSEYQGQAPIITDYHNLRFNKKGRFQVSLSQKLGETGQFGSLYVSGNQQSYWGTDSKDEWYQAGYSNGWKGISYSLSLSTSKSLTSSKRDNLLSLNVSVPLDQFTTRYLAEDNPLNNAFATTTLTKNSRGQETAQVGVSGSLLKEKNLNYSVTQGYANQRNANYSGSLSLSYKGGTGTAGVGYNYDTSQSQVNYNASGAILVHEDGVTLGQQISDTAILIKAPKANNVSVENYIGVKTDRRGYAILPYASSYRINRVALNPDSFGDKLEIENNVDTVIPIQGAIARATFNTSIGYRTLLAITYKDKYIPFGSIATDLDNHQTGIVADEGRIYMTGLSSAGKLAIKWGEGPSNQCIVDYQFTESEMKLPIIKKAFQCI